MSQAGTEARDPTGTTRALTGYLIYGGRYRRVIRSVALVLVTVNIALGSPRPGVEGHGLVILVCLVLADSTQVGVIVDPDPSRRRAAVRAVVGMLASAVLAGFDPGASPTALLVFAGLDVGASQEFVPGAVIAATGVVVEALAALVAGRSTGDAALGLAGIAGFLAATTTKQYVLRAEEAELRLADAERAREANARAAGLAARAEAAREIHDILAHSLGALVLQLDALDAVLAPGQPDRAKAADLLARARALAVGGLTEARRAVGSLRHDPPPIVESLRDLVESTGSAQLEILGTPRPTPPDVSLALRRAAQEGMTNAAKHAPGAVPTVHLDFGVDAVTVTVSDPGRPGGGPPPPLAGTGGGYGLEGLRERARLIGGQLTAGPHDLGWQVRLRVPDEGAAQ